MSRMKPSTRLRKVAAPITPAALATWRSSPIRRPGPTGGLDLTSTAASCYTISLWRSRVIRGGGSRGYARIGNQEGPPGASSSRAQPDDDGRHQDCGEEGAQRGRGEEPDHRQGRARGGRSRALEGRREKADSQESGLTACVPPDPPRPPPVIAP